MKRSAMTKAKRVRIFDANNGVCYLCGCKIQLGEAWEAEHPIALELGGSDKEADLKPAHVDCHKPKTREDRRNIAKTHRVRAKHLGIRKASYRPIRSAPFAKREKRSKALTKQLPPRRNPITREIVT